MHIHVITKDFHWASALAGALVSARKEKRTVNPKFTASIEPTTPEIELLSRAFNPTRTPTHIIRDLSEQDMTKLDTFHGKRMSMEIEMVHGIVSDASTHAKLGFTQLACDTLLIKAKLDCEPSFFFPKDIGQDAPEFSKHIAVVEDETLLEPLQEFLRGWNLSGEIVNLQDVPDRVDRIRYILAPQNKATCVHLLSLYQPILRSTYEDYSKMVQAKLALHVVKNPSELKERRCIAWPGQIGMHDNDLEGCYAKGRAWAEREAVGHDFHTFVKKMAALKEQECQA